MFGNGSLSTCGMPNPIGAGARPCSAPALASPAPAVACCGVCRGGPREQANHRVSIADKSGHDRLCPSPHARARGASTAQRHSDHGAGDGHAAATHRNARATHGDGRAAYAYSSPSVRDANGPAAGSHSRADEHGSASHRDSHPPHRHACAAHGHGAAAYGYACASCWRSTNRPGALAQCALQRLSRRGSAGRLWSQIGGNGCER